MKKLYFIFLIVFCLFLPFFVLGATLFEDDFNSYTDGDLNGQGGWSGNVVFDVQGTTIYEGAKAVSSNASAYIDKIGTLVADGKITFYFQVSAIVEGVAGRFVTMETGYTPAKTHIAWYGVGGVGKVYYYNVSTLVEFGTYVVDTWYSVEQEWRNSDKMARYRYNEGTWTDWDTINQDWVSGIDKVRLQTTGELIYYFDYIAENLYEAPPPPTATSTPEYIFNATTGAYFYLDKTIDYGEILIIFFLFLFLIFEIVKTIMEFFIPRRVTKF